MRRMDNAPPTRQYVVQSGQPPAQYNISSTQQQQRPQNVKYVQSSQPPSQKQYVQGSGIAYREVSNINNNNNETVQVISSNPPQQQQQQQPTLITRRMINSRTTTSGANNNDNVDAQQPAKVEGQMTVNGILAGFLILSFHPSKPVSTTVEARILSLQLVAFGCFLGAFAFYVTYLQRGRRSSMRSWVYCGQLLTAVGLVLLMSSVAVASRVQFGGEFRGVWVVSVSVVIILVGLPILCDIGFCFSRLVMLMLDWFDNLFK